MIENQKIRPDQVVGPLGEPLTLDSLPSPDTTRWVVRRKAEVVAAVNGGLLTVDEACARYSLTLEEFAAGNGRWIARACPACASRASSTTSRCTSASSATESFVRGVPLYAHAPDNCAFRHPEKSDPARPCPAQRLDASGSATRDSALAVQIEAVAVGIGEHRHIAAQGCLPGGMVKLTPLAASSAWAASTSARRSRCRYGGRQSARPARRRSRSARRPARRTRNGIRVPHRAARSPDCPGRRQWRDRDRLR